MSEPTKQEIEAVGSAIVSVDFIDDGHFSDNVAIILAGAYESDRACPEEDQDDETGWKPWALEQEKALRARMARAAITALDKVRAKP